MFLHHFRFTPFCFQSSLLGFDFFNPFRYGCFSFSSLFLFALCSVPLNFRFRFLFPFFLVFLSECPTVIVYFVLSSFVLFRSVFSPPFLVFFCFVPVRLVFLAQSLFLFSYFSFCPLFSFLLFFCFHLRFLLFCLEYALIVSFSFLLRLIQFSVALSSVLVLSPRRFVVPIYASIYFCVGFAYFIPFIFALLVPYCICFISCRFVSLHFVLLFLFAFLFLNFLFSFCFFQSYFSSNCPFLHRFSFAISFIFLYF